MQLQKFLLGASAISPRVASIDGIQREALSEIPLGHWQLSLFFRWRIIKYTSHYQKRKEIALLYSGKEGNLLALWTENLKVGSHIFYLVGKTENLSQGHSLSALRICSSEETRWGANICRSFRSKDQVVRTSKDYCQLKKTWNLKFRSLALFYVWEAVRI